MARAARSLGFGNDATFHSGVAHRERNSEPPAIVQSSGVASIPASLIHGAPIARDALTRFRDEWGKKSAA